MRQDRETRLPEVGAHRTRKTPESPMQAMLTPRVLLILVGVITLLLLIATYFLNDFRQDNSESEDPALETNAAAATNENQAPLITDPEPVDAPQPDAIWLDVPCFLQKPELPTGCESVALTNLLNYHGFNLDKTTIAEEWLPLSGEDFIYSFMGDPHEEISNSCMSPCITLTANDFLTANKSKLKAVDFSDSSFDEVLAQVGKGIPVIAWVSLGLHDPGEPYYEQTVNGKTYYLYHYNHCVVICGYDLNEGTVSVSDSIAGQVDYDLELFEERFYDLGSQAVYLIEK